MKKQDKLFLMVIKISKLYKNSDKEQRKKLYYYMFNDSFRDL